MWFVVPVNRTCATLKHFRRIFSFAKCNIHMNKWPIEACDRTTLKCAHKVNYIVAKIAPVDLWIIVLVGERLPCNSFTPNIQNTEIFCHFEMALVRESTRRTPTTWFSIKIYRTQLKVRVSRPSGAIHRLDATHTQTRTSSDACVSEQECKWPAKWLITCIMYTQMQVNACAILCILNRVPTSIQSIIHISVALDK